ncbi:MAG TPA: hypothetical protein PKV92_09015 [Thermodesulfovibrio thiophilus]|nr:hypothetical protein [Thermodesulfovibrio thiophilus]HQD37218.1 hypothetical protein [Thermodesulfovibrio thiophilus]
MRAKTEVKTKATSKGINLSQLADSYGLLVQKKKELEEQINQLKEEILQNIPEGQTEVNGNDFALQVIKSVKIELDPVQTLKSIPKEQIANVVSIKVTEAKKWLTPKQIEELTKAISEVTMLRVKPVK